MSGCKYLHNQRKDYRVNDAEMISITASTVLTVLFTAGGWFFTRAMKRIDAMEQSIIEGDKSSMELEGRLKSLETDKLTKGCLREVMDAALDKATSPITRELEAIKTSSTETRERLVRLEATFDAMRSSP